MTSLAVTLETSSVSAGPAALTQEQFVALVDTHQALLHKVCSLYCKDPDDRRDLFQEVVLQLWRAMPTFKGNSKVTTWMYRVALNTALTYFRRRQRRSIEGPLEPRMHNLADAPPDPEQADRMRRMYSAIDQLSGLEKALIMLHLEDHSHEEIALILGITQNNLRVKLHRTKEKLKTLVQQLPQN